MHVPQKSNTAMRSYLDLGCKGEHGEGCKTATFVRTYNKWMGKIFVREKYSSGKNIRQGKISSRKNFVNSRKFRQFSPTNFSPIRYDAIFLYDSCTTKLRHALLTWKTVRDHGDLCWIQRLKYLNHESWFIMLYCRMPIWFFSYFLWGAYLRFKFKCKVFCTPLCPYKGKLRNNSHFCYVASLIYFIFNSFKFITNNDDMSPKNHLTKMKHDNPNKITIGRFSVVGWRAEGPSGFSTPRLGGVPSLLLSVFSFSGDEEVES